MKHGTFTSSFTRLIVVIVAVIVSVDQAYAMSNRFFVAGGLLAPLIYFSPKIIAFTVTSQHRGRALRSAALFREKNAPVILKAETLPQDLAQTMFYEGLGELVKIFDKKHVAPQAMLSKIKNGLESFGHTLTRINKGLPEGADQEFLDTVTRMHKVTHTVYGSIGTTSSLLARTYNGLCFNALERGTVSGELCRLIVWAKNLGNPVNISLDIAVGTASMAGDIVSENIDTMSRQEQEKFLHRIRKKLVPVRTMWNEYKGTQPVEDFLEGLPVVTRSKNNVSSTRGNIFYDEPDDNVVVRMVAKPLVRASVGCFVAGLIWRYRKSIQEGCHCAYSALVGTIEESSQEDTCNE